MAKAIALLSGGLDSILAAKLILQQGVDVEGVYFSTVFSDYRNRGKNHCASRIAAKGLGIKLKVLRVNREFFKIVKGPKHGYGKNLNPCIDCRIYTFKKAKKQMNLLGASFIVTGEVLGQRPMSQKKYAMRIIDAESGLEGRVLRPLSAKLMKPTIPEKEGLVDRSKLFGINGRCRRHQIAIAKDLGIDEYLSPSGGCLLTYKQFAGKMRDLIKHKPGFTVNDVKLLKTARIFRLSPGAMLAVGRDEAQNEKLLALRRKGDICLSPAGIAGPTGIVRGAFDNNSIKTACAIIARYSDGAPNIAIEIEYTAEAGIERTIASPIKEEKLDLLRI